MIIGNTIADEGEEENDEGAKKRTLSMQEKAIYHETDALQIEMGNIVTRVSPSGNYLYDTAKGNQRKDRYSSVAMAVRFIAELEENRRRIYARRGNQECIGIVTTI